MLNSNLSLINWNIQTGSDQGLFHNHWSRRKMALASILRNENADIVCLQEAHLEQLEFLETCLNDCQTIAVPRDDGRSKGETCGILIKSSRIKMLETSTFWLSDTPDECDRTWDWPFKRICTWARLCDKSSNKEFFVFNTHFPLNSFVQVRACKLLLQRIQAYAYGQTRLLTGDFNCTPESEVWSRIKASGFVNTENEMGSKLYSRTHHLLGLPLACIDAVFASPDVSIAEHRLLNKQVRGVWPSDHFGILVNFSI